MRVLLWMFSSQWAGFIMQGEAKGTKQMYGGAFAARSNNSHERGAIDRSSFVAPWPTGCSYTDIDPTAAV